MSFQLTGELHASPHATAVAATGGAKRVDAIDFWRGFALVTIFVDHAPENVFAHLTFRNFGFSDAAELFVFMSGVSVAIAYGSRFHNGEPRAALRAIFRRAFTLYWVQVLISLLVIALFTAAALYWDADDLMDTYDHDLLVSAPARAIVAILLLAHQLNGFTILPLYIVLLLLAPVLLALALRSSWLMLAVAAATYGVARVFHLNLPSWPIEGGWYFNPFAWQLIFAIGLFVGARIRNGGIVYDWRLLALCLPVLAASAFVTTDGFALVPGFWDRMRDLLDPTKTDLGLFRIVHFLALAYVIAYSGLTGLMRATPIFAPLALMGRYSLPVFATGCVLAPIGDVIVKTRPSDFNHPLTIAGLIVAVGLLAHYLVARLLAARAAQLMKR
jgi:hypothetical protein